MHVMVNTTIPVYVGRVLRVFEACMFGLTVKSLTLRGAPVTPILQARNCQLPRNSVQRVHVCQILFPCWCFAQIMFLLFVCFVCVLNVFVCLFKNAMRTHCNYTYVTQNLSSLCVLNLFVCLFKNTMRTHCNYTYVTQNLSSLCIKERDAATW